MAELTPEDIKDLRAFATAAADVPGYGPICHPQTFVALLDMLEAAEAKLVLREQSLAWAKENASFLENTLRLVHEELAEAKANLHKYSRHLSSCCGSVFSNQSPPCDCGLVEALA